MFRKDRERDSHGGVFVAVKNEYIASEEKELNTNCESLWISIHIKGLKPTYIGAFYRPPSTGQEYLRELEISLSKIPKTASVWLMGDFNLPDITWSSNSFRTGGRNPSCSQIMLDLVNDFNLTQIVESPTRDRNILDLCFVSHPSLVEYCNVIPGISDHDAVIVKTKMTAKISSRIRATNSYQDFQVRSFLFFPINFLKYLESWASPSGIMINSRL